MLAVLKPFSAYISIYHYKQYYDLCDEGLTNNLCSSVLYSFSHLANWYQLAVISREQRSSRKSLVGGHGRVLHFKVEVQALSFLPSSNLLSMRFHPPPSFSFRQRSGQHLLDFDLCFRLHSTMTQKLKKKCKTLTKAFGTENKAEPPPNPISSDSSFIDDDPEPTLRDVMSAISNLSTRVAINEERLASQPKVRSLFLQSECSLYLQ